MAPRKQTLRRAFVKLRNPWKSVGWAVMSKPTGFDIGASVRKLARNICVRSAYELLSRLYDF